MTGVTRRAINRSAHQAAGIGILRYLIGVVTGFRMVEVIEDAISST
jgi:hypothetical protein